MLWRVLPILGNAHFIIVTLKHKPENCREDLWVQISALSFCTFPHICTFMDSLYSLLYRMVEISEHPRWWNGWRHGSVVKSAGCATTGTWAQILGLTAWLCSQWHWAVRGRQAGHCGFLAVRRARDRRSLFKETASKKQGNEWQKTLDNPTIWPLLAHSQVFLNTHTHTHKIIKSAIFVNY